MAKNLFIIMTLSASLSFLSGCGGGNNITATTSASTSQTPSGTGNTASSTVGTITLYWTAPTTKIDNTPVSPSEINGYRLYYGTSSTNISNYIDINDGNATQYTISLPSGSYYFQISAVDSTGYEGLKSMVIEKSI